MHLCMSLCLPVRRQFGAVLEQEWFCCADRDSCSCLCYSVFCFRLRQQPWVRLWDVFQKVSCRIWQLCSCLGFCQHHSFEPAVPFTWWLTERHKNKSVAFCRMYLLKLQAYETACDKFEDYMCGALTTGSSSAPGKVWWVQVIEPVSSFLWQEWNLHLRVSPWKVYDDFGLRVVCCFTHQHHLRSLSPSSTSWLDELTCCLRQCPSHNQRAMAIIQSLLSHCSSHHDIVLAVLEFCQGVPLQLHETVE